MCKCYIIFNIDGSTVVDETQRHNPDNPGTSYKAVDCLSDKASKMICRVLMEDDTLDLSESDLEWFCHNMYEELGHAY